MAGILFPIALILSLLHYVERNYWSVQVYFYGNVQRSSVCNCGGSDVNMPSRRYKIKIG